MNVSESPSLVRGGKVKLSPIDIAQREFMACSPRDQERLAQIAQHKERRQAQFSNTSELEDEPLEEQGPSFLKKLIFLGALGALGFFAYRHLRGRISVPAAVPPANTAASAADFERMYTELAKNSAT